MTRSTWSVSLCGWWWSLLGFCIKVVKGNNEWYPACIEIFTKLYAKAFMEYGGSKWFNVIMNAFTVKKRISPKRSWTIWNNLNSNKDWRQKTTKWMTYYIVLDVRMILKWWIPCVGLLLCDSSWSYVRCMIPSITRELEPLYRYNTLVCWNRTHTYNTDKGVYVLLSLLLLTFTKRFDDQQENTFSYLLR